MFTKILVALDGSELAEKALPTAQNLAGLSGASIHLIQVISRQPEAEAARSASYGSVGTMEVERDAARKLVEGRIARGKDYLERVADQVRNAGVPVETAIPEGAADENIIAYTKEHGIDLVVISTHGYGGIRRLILGSVTDRVIRSCEVPVLVVPCS